MTESFNRKLGRLAQNVSGTGSITTNASTASAWQTARTITLGGDLSGSVSLDGSSNVSLTATVSGNTVALGTDTTGDYVASVTAGTGITTTGTGEGAAVTVAIDSTVATLTGSQILTNKTLTTPVISSISNTGTLTLPTSTDTLVGRATTDTLTNKTIALGSNTVSGTLAEFNSAMIDADFTSLAGSETLTNKTISGVNNTLSNIGNSSLSNSSITINGTSVSLGGTRTLVTDDIAEDGSPVNLWYTDARTRSAISVTDAGGDGSLSYDSGTGVITYTGPSATEVRAHFSAGTGVTITTGQIAIGQSVGTTNDVTFAGVTADAVRVGVTTAGEIDTTTGNLTLDSAGGTTTIDDNAAVTGNLQIDGNLTVSGTTVTMNTTTLSVEDNMIYLNSGSAVANPDLGFAGNYNDGTYRHAGLFRDASDGVFKFFHQYVPEPDASPYIDITHGTFALAPIQASTFTGNVTGDVTGNASTATTWQTARTLTLTGDVTGTSASFNGSGNISISTTIAADSVALGTDTTGNYVASITNGNYITGGNGGSEGAALTLAVDATSANTASKVVARDASGNFSAGTITATLSGNSTTATTLATARNINGVSFNGSADITVTAAAGTLSGSTLASGVTSSSLTSVGTLTSLAVGGATTITGGSVLIRNAASQDGIELRGRAGGTGNWEAILTPTTLSADRTFTFPDVSGTVVTTGDTGTVTNTMLAGSIANAKLANSTISGISLGSNLGTLTLGVSGTGLSGSQTYNGSGAATFTVTSNATSANTGSTIVARDASGNFSAGTITAALSGNATTSTTAGALTSMNISQFTNNSGYITGLSFDGLSSKTGGTGTYTTSGDFRAPIFYDSNNTAYYIDPNSTGTSLNIAGVINTTAPGGSILMRHSVSEVDAWIFMENASNWGLYWKNNPSGNHVFGGYTSVGAELFGMSAANASGNGVATTNYVGATSAIAQWMLSNYTGYVWSASTVFAAGDMRSPIFYDSNNTGYYTDPASTSNLNALQTYSYQGNGNVGGTGAASWHPSGIYSGGTQWLYGDIYRNGAATYGGGAAYHTIYYDNNNTGYYCDPAATSQLSYVLANDWFRPQGSTGIYFQDYGYGLRSAHGEGNSYGNATTYGGGRNGWSGWGIGTRHVFMSTTGDNVGVHDNSRGWIWYWNGTYTEFPYGYTIHGGSSRSPIFYDQNDTGYYVDPASTSITNQMRALYFANYYDVAADHPFGIYFASGLSTAYGIFRESGAWNWPYPDLRIAFHTGIKFGANAGYKGMNFYTDYDMSSLVMSVNNADYVTSGVYVHSDLRAPILYDANDTGYYCNPNGTSYMYRTIFQGRMLFYGGDQSADGTNDAQLYFTPGGGLTVASITTTFETGFVGSSYPNNRQAGAQATYDKRFYVWQDLVQYYSDERLKEKTGTLAGALDAIKSWTPFKYVDNALANSFNFGSDKPQIGLSAQEVQQSYPELVELAPFDTENDFSDETNPRRVSKSGENYLTLNYTRLVPVLVQAIKEQQAKIEELERRINNS